MLRVRRPSSDPPALGEAARSRPILLATFDVPFDERATRLAVDSAVETGQALIVANVVEVPPLPMSVALGYDQLEYPPEMEASLRAPVALASSLGVRVEWLRVRTLHPVMALLELAREREPGVLVFGPDRSAMPRRRYARAARAVRDEAPCLVWMPS